MKDTEKGNKEIIVAAYAELLEYVVNNLSAEQRSEISKKILVICEVHNELIEKTLNETIENSMKVAIEETYKEFNKEGYDAGYLQALTDTWVADQNSDFVRTGKRRYSYVGEGDPYSPFVEKRKPPKFEIVRVNKEQTAEKDENEQREVLR